MIECLKNLSGDSEMTVRDVYEWKTDDRYIQQARVGGRWIADGGIGCTGNRCNLTNEQDSMLAWYENKT